MSHVPGSDEVFIKRLISKKKKKKKKKKKEKKERKILFPLLVTFNGLFYFLFRDS